MTDLITEELVVLDLVATDKADATRQLAEKLQAAGRVTDLDGFLADVAAREAQMATGMPGGDRPAARALRARHGARASASAGCPPGSTSVRRTVRPPWCSSSPHRPAAARST